MIVMISVLESALTVSPTLMPTETTVPAIGLVSDASLSDCSALVSCASAVSMEDWSLAICSGVSVLPDDPPVPPVPPILASPAPELPVMSAVRLASVLDVAWLPWVGEEPVFPVPPPPEPVDGLPLLPPDVTPRACASAVSSFETVFWSLETCCSSAETVWRAASQVA